MLAVCCLSLALALGAGSSPVRVSPEAEIAQDIIAAVDNYLEDHMLTELKLPSFDPTPLYPLSFSDGTVGEFNTLRLQEPPKIRQTRNSDGSTTYTFDIRSGLDELSIRYNFKIKLAWRVIQSGNFSLKSLDNSLQTTGIVVINQDGSCEANLYGVSVVTFEDFDLKINPYNIPFIDKIYDTILNYVYPKYLPMINLALKGVVLSTSLQSKFSELVCNQISHYSPKPEPTTPVVTTLEPSTPEATTSEPSTPEPEPEATTPELTTVEPATPEPSTPEPATPEPSTPEPATPEPSTH